MTVCFFSQSTLATVVLRTIQRIVFSRLTQMPNRLKNDKSLMMREFCQFLQD